MDFQGRVAIVTGGAGALGSAVSLELAQVGVRVAVPYTSDKGWKALEQRLGLDPEHLWGAKADLTDVAATERFVASVAERCGRVDFLVCIAGGFAAGNIAETDAATWDGMFDMNLKTLFTAARAVVPLMIRQKFGRIITTSSGAILNGGGAGIAAYAISKGAVRQFTEILAAEVSDHNIHVHCILPGTMDTEGNRRDMPKADFSQWVPTSDVARVIRFLLSDDAGSIRSVEVPILGRG